MRNTRKLRKSSDSTGGTSIADLAMVMMIVFIILYIFDIGPKIITEVPSELDLVKRNEKLNRGSTDSKGNIYLSINKDNSLLLGNESIDINDFESRMQGIETLNIRCDSTVANGFRQDVIQKIQVINPDILIREVYSL